MKVAILADPIDNQRGGIHVYTRELVKALEAEPGDHHIVLIRSRRDPDCALPQIIIPYTRVGLIFVAIRTFFLIPFLCWWHRVDAVFEPAHFGPFNLPGRIFRITMIHDLTPLRFPEYHRWHSQMLQRIFLRRILRKADLVLTNSQATRRDVEAEFPFCAQKTKTILLGLPEKEVSKAKSSPIPVGGPYFLAVGTIEPRKNLIRLIAAFASLRQAIKTPVSLVIIGQRGWKADPFFAALAHHPFKEDIHIQGFVSDGELAEYYKGALALIYPTEYEGFGFPVIEAYSLGCPVVCSHTSSLPEVGGDLAIYVDPLDVSSILRGMMELMEWDESKRSEWKIQAALWADTFTWQRYGRAFHQVLDEFEQKTGD